MAPRPNASYNEMKALLGGPKEMDVIKEELSKPLEFTFPVLLEPFSSNVEATLSDPSLSYGHRIQRIDKSIEEYLNSLSLEQLYPSFVDAFLYATHLAHFCNNNDLNRSYPRWVANRMMVKMLEHASKMSQQQLLVATDKISSMENRDRFFAAMLPHKCYREFMNGFCNPKVYACFFNFLVSRIDYETGPVLKWMRALEYTRLRFDYVKLRCKTIVTSAIVMHETSLLMDMAKDSKPFARLVVAILELVAKAMFKEYDAEYAPLPIMEQFRQLRKREKEVVSLCFRYQKAFDFDEKVVQNSIFVRKMNAFISAFREYKDKNATKAPDREGLIQKAIFISKGSERVLTSILRYMSVNCARSEAMAVAMRLKMSDGEWQSAMQWYDVDDGMLKSARLDDQNSEEISRMSVNQEVKTRTQTGERLPVHLIDTDAKIYEILAPFLNDERNESFGFDAEWDQSFCGEMGTLCLMQFSSTTGTVLIDVVTMREKLEWSDAKMRQIFSMLFAHKKPIYGYAVENDMKTIAHNYAFVGTDLFPQLQNIYCLFTAVKILREDEEMYRRVFQIPPYNPIDDKMNLAAVSRMLLGVNLSKSEQSNVWSYRPLRVVQQRYAAYDAHYVREFALKAIERFKALCPSRLSDLLQPVRWSKDSATVETCEVLAKIESTKRTKCSHFKTSELIEIVKEANDELYAAGTAQMDTNQSYVTDTMCTQLGFVLKRLGISAHSGDGPEDVLQIGLNNPATKILTTGKAVAKYPFPGRVLNIKSSESLDRQLKGFLVTQKIHLDIKNIRPRCAKCNSNTMCYLPTAVMRYFNYCSSNERGFDDAATEEDIVDAEKEMENCHKNMDKWSIKERGMYGFVMCSGVLGRFIQTREAVVDLNNQLLYRKLGVSKPVKMTFATHINFKTTTFPERCFHAVCVYCGRENVDAMIGGD